MCTLRPDDNDHASDRLWNEKIERDLRRIETEKALCPPPADPNSERWNRAWAHFECTYVPALRAFFEHLLRGGRSARVARQEAEELVRTFVATRLQDGRLENARGPIRSFRGWLARQVRCFVFDQQRHTGALCRQPEGGLVSIHRVLDVASPESEDAAMRRFDEQLVDEITAAVIQRVAARSEEQADVLRDLVRNAGVQSADFAARIGKAPRDLTALRSRARTSFRQELCRIGETGLFTETDIEDLISLMRRRYRGPA